MTKLYISVDIEGIAGVVHWDKAMASGADYCGPPATDGGVENCLRNRNDICVQSITVNDAHSTMRSVIPDELPSNVRLVTGHFKPMYMMEGLDGSFDAAIFLGYHGAAGSRRGPLTHINPRGVIWEARLYGVVTAKRASTRSWLIISAYLWC